MSKKHEYPQNTSMAARMDAIIRGFSSCRNTLRNIRDLVADSLPKEQGATVGRAIDDALEDAEVASRAISGNDVPALSIDLEARQ